MNKLSSVGLVALLFSMSPLAQADIIYGSQPSGPLTTYDTVSDTTTVLASGLGNLGLSFNASGELFGLASSALYRMDTVTGAATSIGTGSYNSHVEALTFDLSGRLIAGTSSAPRLYEVSTVDGSSTDLGAVTGMSDIDGLTVNPVDVNTVAGLVPAGTLFAIDSGRLYTINSATLVATFLHTVNGAADETIAFASDGTLYGNWGSYHTIDLVSGATALVGGPRSFGSAVVPVDVDAAARINVTKTFSDENPGSVTVTLECNDGFISQDGIAEISHGGHHTFIVTDFTQGSMDCTVTESGGPGGYTSTPANGCVYDNMTGGFRVCDFVNTAKDATYTVTKDWMIPNTGGDVVIEEAEVTITCILDSGAIIRTVGSLGDGESLKAIVDVKEGPATCSASEEDLASSGVETTNNCAKVVLSADEDYSCEITNLVFFEGVPTLSDYGLALMALLMLGVGFVGVRRFI